MYICVCVYIYIYIYILGFEVVDAHFEAQQQEDAQKYGQRRVSGWLEEPLSLDGRSSGSQAHKVHKWALRKANGPKGAQKEKQKSPWALCDVAK